MQRRIILITGTTSGIGHSLLLQLASEPNNIIISLSKSTLNVEEIIIAKGSVVDHYIIDLGDMMQLQQLISKLKIKYSYINVLINNAALLVNKPAQTYTPLDWDQVLKVNTIAPAILINELIELLSKSSQRGCILNIASVGGIQGSAKFPGLLAYSTSKGALITLTECLAAEYSNYNVSINCLALGSTDTNMFQKAFPKFKASLNPLDVANFIKDFITIHYSLLNGKTLQLSNSTP